MNYIIGLWLRNLFVDFESRKNRTSTSPVRCKTVYSTAKSKKIIKITSLYYYYMELLIKNI